jgi:hypothetical protein
MSIDPYSDVVVLAARRNTFIPLLDVLRDWSSVGLISPLHIIDVDAVRPGEVRFPCTVLEDGVIRSVVLQEELAVRASTGRARVCALTQLAARADTVGKDEALRLVDTLRNALPAVEPSRIHIIGVNLQGAAPEEDIGWLGWHNVVVAPENSQSPTAGVSPVVQSTTDPIPLTHFAAAVCSLAGAWAAEPRSPFDDRSVAPGSSVMVARTFTRHLSAAAVESELLARLANVQQGYPVPLFEGSSAQVVDDEVGAASAMADALLEKHSLDVFPRPRETPRRTPQTKIGALEALRMLFAFLWQALRNAPRAFLDSAVRRVSAGTAAFVGGAAFGGADAQYTVVVNGIRADGTPASWPEIDEALEAASSRIQGPVNVGAASNADLSGLWQDFIGGGLTLLDAELRSQQLPPSMQGAKRAIVTTPTRVAVDPSDTYQPPENVSAFIKDRTVASYDVVAARTLDRQLSEVSSSQPHVSAQAGAAQHELREWFEVRRRSYTGRVGWTLSKSLEEVRSQIAQYVASLDAAQAQAAVPSQIEEQQRALSRRLKIVGGLALLAALGLVLLAVLGPPTWLFAAITVPLVIVLWLVVSTFMFLRGQRDLFALLHQRQEMANQLEILQRNLSAAMDDMRRLTRAYRQYLDWCKAFGRFVQVPLGKPPARTDDEILLGTGFPLNHRFGAARPEQPVIDEISEIMRRDLFRVGWTSDAWEAFLGDVPREMGPTAFRVQESADLLFTDPGLSRQSLLSAWADAVTEREDWAGAARNLREKVEQVLGGGGRNLTSRLLANVETRSPRGEVQSMTHESFVSGLDSDAAKTGAFARGIFTDQALNTEPWRVADTVINQSRADLGRTIVVTQLSQGFSSYALHLGPDQKSSTATEPVVERSGPDRPIL